MIATSKQQYLYSFPRASVSLNSERCQTILYKSVFEQFNSTANIAALLLASKSFQNSTFGPNFLFNYIVEKRTISLFKDVLSPSSCLPLQFIPSLYIEKSNDGGENTVTDLENFAKDLFKTKYLALQLRSFSLTYANSAMLSACFENSTTFPHLHSLELRQSGIGAPLMAAIVKAAPRLTSLDVEDSNIDDASLQHVSSLSRIASLNLAGCCKITPAGFEHHLPKCSSLTCLDLRACYSVTDEDLQYITKCGNIASLVLNSHNMTDVGLQLVCTLSALTHLDLAWCRQITDDGLREVSKLSRINYLDLSFCLNIDDEGIQNISSLSNLSTLILAGCNLITDAGVEIISEFASFLTHLSLDQFPEITDAGLGHLSKLSKLTFLNIRHCAEITDAGLERISKMSCITSLNLERCNKVTDAGLLHISQLSRIESLNLAECDRITDAGIVHVSNLSNITFLDISWCPRLASIDCILKLTKLRRLRGAHTRIDYRSRSILQNRLPMCNVE